MATRKAVIGYAAIDRAGGCIAGSTYLSEGGYLFEGAGGNHINKCTLWAAGTLYGFIVALFAGNIATRKSVDSYSIGTVAGGSAQSFTGIDLVTVALYNFIGFYHASGNTLDLTVTEGTYNAESGNLIDGSEHDFNPTYTGAFSLYGETYGAPTVTTQAASSIGVTTATGNGNITNTGGYKTTDRRGFCYKVGTSGDPTIANSVAYDNGTFGTGAYTKGITGLIKDTGYRVRAYSTDADGETGYGATVQITTLPLDRNMAGESNIVFSATGLSYADRAMTGETNIVFSALLAPSQYVDMAGESNIVFDAIAEMYRDRNMAGQSDIVFTAVAEMYRNRNMTGQSNIVFDALASMYADRNMQAQSNIVFDALALLYAIRTMTGQADIAFTAALLVYIDRNMAGQSDIELSTYCFIGIDGDQGFIAGY